MPSKWGVGPTMDWLGRMMYPDEPLPYVDPPNNRRPEIPVVGDRDLAREVYMYAKKHPEIEGNVSRVSLGPTSASMRKMIQSNLPIDAFEDTNLLGIYGLQDKGIGINPGYPVYSPERSDILGHELGHASGLMRENAADEYGYNWRNYYLRNPYGGRKK